MRDMRLMHRVYVIKLIDIFFDSKYSKCNTRKSYRISDLSINRRNWRISFYRSFTSLMINIFSEK